MDIVPYANTGNTNPSDKQTIIVQYSGRENIAIIQDYFRNKRKNSSHTIINDWICIDGFVNLDWIWCDTGVDRCVRIVYELLDGNPAPSPLNDRFGDCYIVSADIEKIKIEMIKEVFKIGNVT